MVNDLRALLRESVDAPPPDESQTSDVLLEGHRRVRRRQLVVVTSVAAAVAVGVIATSVVAGLTDEKTAPVSPPHPSFRLLSLDDAVPAIEGADYTQLSSLEHAAAGARSGYYQAGLTQDGLVVLRDDGTSAGPTGAVDLLDPESGERTELPDPPSPLGNLVALTSDRLVWVSTASDEDSLALLVFDRGDETWEEPTWSGLPTLRDDPDVRLGPDDRAYVTARSDDPASINRYELWSVSLEDTSDVQDEDAAVSRFFEIAGGELTWDTLTQGAQGFTTEIHTRDLESGDESTLDAKADERCGPVSTGIGEDPVQAVWRTPSYVVVEQTCGDDDKSVMVFTGSGDPVATIVTPDRERVFPGEEALVIAVGGSERPGTYVYDFESQELLRISDEYAARRQAFCCTAPELRVSGRTFLWEVPEGDGTQQLVGRLE